MCGTPSNFNLCFEILFNLHKKTFYKTVFTSEYFQLLFLLSISTKTTEIPKKSQ